MRFKRVPIILQNGKRKITKKINFYTCGEEWSKIIFKIWSLKLFNITTTLKNGPTQFLVYPFKRSFGKIRHLMVCKSGSYILNISFLLKVPFFCSPTKYFKAQHVSIWSYYTFLQLLDIQLLNASKEGPFFL